MVKTSMVANSADGENECHTGGFEKSRAGARVAIRLSLPSRLRPPRKMASTSNVEQSRTLHAGHRYFHARVYIKCARSAMMFVQLRTLSL